MDKFRGFVVSQVEGMISSKIAAITVKILFMGYACLLDKDAD